MSSKHKGGEGGKAEGDNPEPFLKSARRVTNDSGKLVSFRVKVCADGAEKEYLLPASSLGSREAFRKHLAYRGCYVPANALAKGADWLRVVADAVRAADPGKE